jgi:hypothetical protein
LAVLAVAILLPANLPQQAQLPRPVNRRAALLQCS